jgi:AcrR family transcriptional regulator
VNEPLVQAQRARVLDAMVAVAGEQGFGSASVETVVKRARVSRRTFYEQFDSLEDCFAAVLEEALERSGAMIAEAFERAETWEDGVLGALSGLLVLFDSEPVHARVWLIEAVAAGSWAFEQRERNVAVLRRLILEHRPPPREGSAEAPQPDSPSVVGVMAAVLGVIHTHLITRQPEPLIMLLGPLMGIVCGTSIDPHNTAREVKRGEERTRQLLSEPYLPPRPVAQGVLEVEIPAGLRDPRAHRARLCLRYLFAHPGASNSQVGAGVGVADHTQISKLLSRLYGLGLLEKSPGAPGRPNAWSLSEQGVLVAQALGDVVVPH